MDEVTVAWTVGALVVKKVYLKVVVMGVKMADGKDLLMVCEKVGSMVDLKAILAVVLKVK